MSSTIILKKQVKKRIKVPVEKVCSCRVPTDEYIQLEKELRELGYKNMSSYFRQIIIDRKREYNLSEIEQYKVFLINKISNNINQIAKSMHQDRKKYNEINYQYTSKQLDKYLNELYTLIG